MRNVLLGLALGGLVAGSAFSQSVISAHSGVVHYIQGDVFLGDKPVNPKPSEFAEVKNGGVLRTAEGRAEVLLTPGVFIRVGENSSVRMVSNRLSDTRVEILSGEAIVECDELLKDNAITILESGATVALTKHGLYRFDATPARLRVYEGEAIVKNASGQLTAKKGKEVMLGGALMAVKFDTKVGDELLRWARSRSNYVAMANVSSARSLTPGYSFAGSNGMWRYNPWFGMFTFIPATGVAWSPFGFPFWSPYAAYYYMPYYGGYYGPGGGRTYTPAPSPSMNASTFSGSPRWSSASMSSSGGFSGSAPAHSMPSGPAGGGIGGGGAAVGGGGSSAGGGGGHHR